jgi:hypothetical protein
MTEQSKEHERAAFEAWPFFEKMNDAAREYAWRGWLERATQASAPADLVEEAMRLVEEFGKAAVLPAINDGLTNLARFTDADNALRTFLAAHLRAQPPAGAVPAGWLPIEEAPKNIVIVLAEAGRSFRGYWHEVPFREYRDMDGFYTGQQDAEAYWARAVDGDECHPTHWQPDVHPPAPQGAEHGGGL